MVSTEGQSDKRVTRMMAGTSSCIDANKMERNRREYIFDIFSCAWMKQKVFPLGLEVKDETELENILFDALRSTCVHTFDVSFYTFMKFIMEGEIEYEDLEKIRKKVNITLC